MCALCSDVAFAEEGSEDPSNETWSGLLCSFDDPCTTEGNCSPQMEPFWLLFQEEDGRVFVLKHGETNRIEVFPDRTNGVFTWRPVDHIRAVVLARERDWLVVLQPDADIEHSVHRVTCW
jgi:hypothetical protein